jgi:hypothetical protein
MRVVFLYPEEEMQRTILGSHLMEQDDISTDVPSCDVDTGRMLDDDDRIGSFLCDKARKMLACHSDGPRLQTSHVGFD